MPEAKRVHSTPPTNTSKPTAGAPGAVQSSPLSLIPASGPGASQALASVGEPHAGSPTCSSGEGGSMTRRFLMNTLVAFSIAGVPTSSALAGGAFARKPTKEELYAYAEWLSNEHRMLMHELGEPENFSPVGTAARAFHFPSGDRTWEDVPKPSTRCLSVFEAIRVDASKSDWMARCEEGRDPDPIFVAIDTHRRVVAARDTTLREHSLLEGSLPANKRQSSITVWEEKIVDTDAPERIAGEHAAAAAFESDAQATSDLANVVPTTVQGVAAILAYVTEVMERGGMFCHLVDEDEESASFEFFLMSNCAEALSNMPVAS
jgi:hypothetical protein